MLKPQDKKMISDLIWYYNERTGSDLDSKEIVDMINKTFSCSPVMKDFTVLRKSIDGDFYVANQSKDTSILKTYNYELDKVIVQTDETPGFLMFRIYYGIDGSADYLDNIDVFQLVVELGFKGEFDEDYFRCYLNYCTCHKANERDLEYDEYYWIRIDDFIAEAMVNKIKDLSF